jgi:hypothetical protein
VNPPTYREVSFYEYLGKTRAALFSMVFCSFYWEQTCCRKVVTPTGRKMRIEVSLYPPGGKRSTAMRRCGACGKWAPPDIPSGTCVDCRTEDNEEAFEARLRHIWKDRDEEFIKDLVRLRGRRPCVLHKKNEKKNKKKDKKKKTEPDERPFLPDWLHERQDGSMPSEDDRVSFWQRTSGGRHWVCELLDTTEKAVPRRASGEVVRAIARHLKWVARDSHRRACGCSVVVLPEDDEALQAEIVYHKITDRVMPRAKREGVVNPRQRYRHVGRRRRRKR